MVEPSGCGLDGEVQREEVDAHERQILTIAVP